MPTSTRTQRLSVIGAIAATAVTAAVVIGPGAWAQVPSAGARTIAFTEVEAKTPCCLIDLAPKSRSKLEPFMSPGDQLIFSQVLRDASRTQIGRVYGKCTAVTAAPLTRARFVCEGIYSFADGTMSATSIGGVGKPTGTGAITGGTGAYANARGTFSSKNSETHNDTVVTLVG